MTDETMSKLRQAADRYLDLPIDDPQKPALFEAIQEWIAQSYAEDGDMTEEELAALDMDALAWGYIQNRAGT